MNEVSADRRVLIERKLDVAKTADRVIDLGPERGVKGGEIVAEDVPEVMRELAGVLWAKFGAVVEAASRERSE